MTKTNSPDLDLDQVHIRSDDEPRTVQSAHALMLGLYPPSDDADVAQIVNLHTMDYQGTDNNNRRASIELKHKTIQLNQQ